MKRSTILLCLLLFSYMPGSVLAAEPVVKTFCALAIGHGNAAALRAYLLTNAKRMAVSELFGEVIVAATTVDNFVVTSDEIVASSAGIVRIQGSPTYFNGTNLAETCVTIQAYVTADDLMRFQPFTFSKRVCIDGSDRIVAEVRRFAQEEVLIRALIDYDRELVDAPRSDLLKLAKQVIYTESGFLPDTETFCASVEGRLIPMEVTAFVQTLQASSITVTPSPVSATPTATTANTPTPTATATPVAIPDATATQQALLALVQATVEAIRTAEAEETAEQQAIVATLTALVPSTTPTVDVTATAAARETSVQATVQAIRTAGALATAEQQVIQATLTALAPPPTPTQRPTATPIPQQAAPLSLVYVRGNVGDTDIWVMEFESRATYPVATERCDEAEPAWFPNGQAVIYQANCDGSYELYRVDLADGRKTRLTWTVQLDEREPDVSHDGRSIAFRASGTADDRNRDGDIWIMQADGQNLQRLGIRGRSPVWSPDSTTLAYMSERNSSWNIYTYNLSSGQERQITQCRVNCRWPAWSPDGSSLLYHTTTGIGSVTADTLWYVSATGGNAIPITSGEHSGRGSWSNEGLIVFNSDKGVEYARLDGGGRNVLISGGENWAPIWSR